MPPLFESPIIEAYASGPCDSICSLPFNFRCHPEMLISCQGDGERDRLIRPQAGVVETIQEPCALPGATHLFDSSPLLLPDAHPISLHSGSTLIARSPPSPVERV